MMKHWAFAILAAASLSGCGAVYDPKGFWDNAAFWDEAPPPGQGAIAAVNHDDWSQAEKLGTEALRRNIQDPYAILALALVYQNTNRAPQARRYYEALATTRPQELVSLGRGDAARTLSIAEVARINLAALDGIPAGQTPKRTSARPSAPTAAGMDNVILRFQTLQRLLDEGLITRDEYDARRSANLPALLRYSSGKPVDSGLEQPALPPGEVADRLQTLAENLRQGSISDEEQSAERTAILDGLLPLSPARSAGSAPLLDTEAKSAAAIDRVRRMREAGIISAADEEREKTAIWARSQSDRAQAAAAERARAEAQAQAQAQAQAKTAAGSAAATALTPASAAVIPPAAPVSSTPLGGGVGIRLGQVGSDAQAQGLWTVLKEKFPTQLGGLSPVLGKASGKGGLALDAGPVADRGAAQHLCLELAAQKQPCAPVTLP